MPLLLSSLWVSYAICRDGRLDVPAAGFLNNLDPAPGVLWTSCHELDVVEGASDLGVRAALMATCAACCVCTVHPGFVLARVRILGRSGAMNQHGATLCAHRSDSGSPLGCRVVDSGGGSRSQVGHRGCA